MQTEIDLSQISDLPIVAAIKNMSGNYSDADGLVGELWRGPGCDDRFLRFDSILFCSVRSAPLRLALSWLTLIRSNLRRFDPIWSTPTQLASLRSVLFCFGHLAQLCLPRDGPAVVVEADKQAAKN